MITVILVIPAVYAVLSMREVRSIASTLRSRDASALLILGELQSTIEQARQSEQIYTAIYNDPVRAPVYRVTLDSTFAEVDTRFRRLRQHEAYARETNAANRHWHTVEERVRSERRLLDEQGDTIRARLLRESEILPAFMRVDSALYGIADAITRSGDEDVERAQHIAGSASNTTWLALAFALGLTVVIGSILTRSLLRPIEQLRRGMAHVAEGDFEPNVRVPTERPDEIGDLARSFATMTEQLAELDRLKAEFVSVASHEIKTPLSVIRGYVSLLADGIYGAVNEAQQKTLSNISDQVDRLTRLVHRLLDISRFEAGGGRLEIRRINVRDFMDELTDGFRVLAMQNGIDFAVSVAGDVPVNIEGDADRLNEVLGNLLSNAFKFTASGGSIRVDVRRGGPGVVVEVEDTGVGIPPEKLPKIFEKFY
ncbi:MAG TPA: HAMP domain-containing sensor histidine kinase, partial [Longimicrobium sp.]|nr:HAMP domain-containing sensor histidine kinase [Longimicrobium sp.]